MQTNGHQINQHEVGKDVFLRVVRWLTVKPLWDILYTKCTQVQKWQNIFSDEKSTEDCWIRRYYLWSKKSLTINHWRLWIYYSILAVCFVFSLWIYFGDTCGCRSGGTSLTCLLLSYFILKSYRLAQGPFMVSQQIFALYSRLRNEISLITLKFFRSCPSGLYEGFMRVLQRDLSW